MALTKVKINLGTEGNLSGSRSIIQSTKTLVSSSAQIASNISGSITSVSSSTATRIATNLASINTLNGSGTAQGVGTSDSPTFNDVTVTGTLTAQEVHTEFESASILFTSGSTKFGNSGDDIHNMTGSIRVSGSAANESFILGHNLGIGTNAPIGGGLDVLGDEEALVVRTGDSGRVGIALKNTGTGTDVNFTDGLLIKLDSDESGFVGLAASNPSQVLNLGAAGNNILQLSGSGRVTVREGLLEVGEHGVAAGQIVSDGDLSIHAGFNDSSTGNGDIIFKRYGESATAEEISRFTSTGRLGIGTSSPLAKLHVEHTTDDTDENGNIAMTVGGGASGNVRHYWGINNSSNYAYYGAVEHGTQYVPLVLQPNGSKVGIGAATSPDGILHAKVTTNTSETIRLQNDDTLSTLGVSSDGYSFLTFQTALHIVPWDGSTWGGTKVYIGSNGRLGVGETSPNNAIHVAASTDSTDDGVYPVVFTENGNATGNSYAGFKTRGRVDGSNNVDCFFLSDGANELGFIGTNTNYNFEIRTNGSTVMRFTNGNDVVVPGANQNIYFGGTRLSGEHDSLRRRLKQYGSGDNYMTFGCYEDNGYGYIENYNNSVGLYYWLGAGGCDMIVDAGGGSSIRPYQDVEFDLGESSYRFADVYASNGTIQTSDKRMKDNIKESSLGLDFINKLNPVQYKWKDYESVKPASPDGQREEKTIKHTYERTHYGLIAQEVEKVLTDSGLTTKDFAPIIYDEDADRYGMRYTEMIGILIKGMQELSAKIEALEK